ncbi:hypothetical protein CGRA01v4_11235 [Colletotrichum graminicola]|nr:hypothetical protein CGRA01v4_11235 [Colletotrichum graminicola]
MTSKTQDKEQQAWGRGRGGWWSFGLVCLGRGVDCVANYLSGRWTCRAHTSSEAPIQD